MINLRLAEYDLETGKFVRFLELGKDFGYYGNFILVSNDLSQNFEEENTPVSESEQDGSCGSIPSSVVRVLKDKKDPLKRFNGLFNGITFGKGIFILIENYKDIITANVNYEDIIFYNIGRGYYSFTHNFFYKK